MSQTNYDDQKLKAYLFGELAAAETEQFDELNFTDENFAAGLSAAENDLIDTYLQRELNGADLKKFEAVYLSTKHRREKIEFARAFQTFAKTENAGAETNTEKAGFFAAWNIFGNRNRVFQFGFAAAALLVLFFGVLWVAVIKRNNADGEIAMQKTPTPESAATTNQNIQPKNENKNSEDVPSAITNPATDDSQNVNQIPAATNQKNSGANKNSNETNRTTKKEAPPEKVENNPPKPIIASFLLAPPLRGANKIPLFNVPKKASQVSVELQLDAGDYEAFHVTLTNETGDINLWRRGSLKARNKGANKVLSISFPAKLLNNGFYSLTVSGVNKAGEAEIVANYPFRSQIK